MKLENYVSGSWQNGEGEEHQLIDPVSGEALAVISTRGIDMAQALAYSRQQGNRALQQYTYQQRAEMLGKIAALLTANKASYADISLRNLGATEADTAFDVDGAIFTLKYFAKAAQTLAQGKFLTDGGQVPLAKDAIFAGQHLMVPLAGVAVFINAFNFPAWGLWEKAAPALLSGVPVLIKPASPTAWLTQKMVVDVIAADILPPGALSIVCGASRDLLDYVSESDVISFTGSAHTAGMIKTHPAVIKAGVRVNIEADSVNSVILGEDASAGCAEFDLMVKEIVREMTTKAGQKCTAIRRIFAPAALAQSLGEAVAARLAKIGVGNPRNSQVRMGPLVNKAQQAAALSGLVALTAESTVVFGNNQNFQLIDADAERGCFVQPTLLFCNDAANAQAVHDVEVFGPVATIIPYSNQAELISLVRRGKGSLVASIFSANVEFCQKVVAAIADLHGRIMVVDGQVGSAHSGHGNVMPSCLHGGPGRAGGGEELGGLRALSLYHRRLVVQASPSCLQHISMGSVAASLLSA